MYDVDRGEASFLEVNTRLQVEHPVTEAVTRVDLVAWMLQLAQGDSSFLDEVPDEGPAIEGHAVEVRVYAEDPRKDYQPSAGLLTEVVYPEDPTVRVDAWAETGQQVTSHYDPMLAKVIVHATGRTEAFAASRRALAATRFTGVQTNLPLLREAVGAARRARRDAHHRHARGRHRRRALHRRRPPGRHDDRAGLAGPARVLGRRHLAVGADGRPLVPARQPRARQRRRARRGWSAR